MIDKSSRKQRLGSYVLEFQAEPSCFHKRVRYHWIISLAHKPDQLVSWGYAATPELAELASRNEVKDLNSGLSQGGQVTKTHQVALHRR
jgi:hypothetical protein